MQIKSTLSKSDKTVSTMYHLYKNPQNTIITTLFSNCKLLTKINLTKKLKNILILI